jgi:hypothetical protein
MTGDLGVRSAVGEASKKAGGASRFRQIAATSANCWPGTAIWAALPSKKVLFLASDGR